MREAVCPPLAIGVAGFARRLFRVSRLHRRALYDRKAPWKPPANKKTPHREGAGWINAQRKIGPYLLVVLADFKLVVALALALGWLNSLAA